MIIINIGKDVGEIVSYKTGKECKLVLAFWIVNVLKMLLSKYFLS